MPDAELIVSTTTTTGQAVARKSIPEADHAIFFPLDLPFSVARSLRVVRPDVFVSVESEIWPNFFAAAKRMGVRVLVVNGIVSDRTVLRGHSLRGVYRWTLGNVCRALMQTGLDQKRLIELGADSARVEVVGNCKFDQENGPLAPEQATDMRRIYGVADGQNVFVAGSTNPGEDEPAFDALIEARKTHPRLKMIIAPRQIERADEIGEMAASRGLSFGRRSEGELKGSEDVVILDTFGELGSVYGIGDVAFVGGSLIPKGGHNILQPISQGKPVFFGPHTFKSRDLVRQASAYQVGFEIADGKALGDGIARLLSDHDQLKVISERAAEMMAANRGASNRCAQAIADAARGKS